MTVELITGYSGAAHIDSSDVQHLIAGVVGPGSYVLQTQNKLSLTVNSANKVTLNTGDAVVAGGAHVRVSAAEALTVTSGTQGANRNDLVVLRYTKNSSNVESAAVVVIKGTATSGTASDPAYNTGSIIDGKSTVDMPLYRLPISGVNLGTPVKLFSEQPSMKALGDSVSQSTDVTVTSSDAKVVVSGCKRYGNVVTVWGRVSESSEGWVESTLIGLPKPAGTVGVTLARSNYWDNAQSNASITSEGHFIEMVYSSGNSSRQWSATYVI